MTRVIGRFRFAGLLAGMALSVSAIAARAQEVPVAPPQQAPPQQATGVLVDSVVVRGNQRVEESVIRVTSALQPGQRVTALAIQNAIRRLMATDAYSDVQIFSEGDPAYYCYQVCSGVVEIVLVVFDDKNLWRVPGLLLRTNHRATGVSGNGTRCVRSCETRCTDLPLHDKT